MNLIIGGAYQGKSGYAREHWGLADGDVFTCGDSGEIDWSAPCIDAIENLTLRCVREKVDSVELFREHRDSWRGSVLICADISGGVVPVDALERAWREETGRLCAWLAGEAETVTRLFCGIPGRLK